ncbi:MAG: ABC transporter permease [Clostridiales bacterium]|nr:ABC transporter permease [Clostridiales bacterium]
MKINTVNYLVSDAFKSLRRNKTISLASVITVFITFIVLGVFSLIAQNASLMIAGVQDKIEIKVYLDKDIKLIDEREIQIKIREEEGVSDIQYESAEQAYKNVEENNPNFLKGYTLEKNPFPASYIVKLDDASRIDDIVSDLENLPGVESIGNQQEMIETMQNVVKGVKWIGTGLFIILIGVSVFLIMNTTKLTVYARRREVGIMKFVGATDWFIRWPFIIEGMVIGFVGTLLSIIPLYFGYRYVCELLASSLSFMMVSMLSPTYIITTLLLEFALGGIVVGGIASYLALRKFLKV